jgi:hypothetical protein
MTQGCDNEHDFASDKGEDDDQRRMGEVEAGRRLQADRLDRRLGMYLIR